MKHFLIALVALGISITSFKSLADDAPLVLELFTSQGCSSCPRADRLLGKLAERDDVIVLSCHVTYWNYLGWKDSFSLEACDTRQSEYRRQLQVASNYTPQLLINGRFETVGSNAEKVEKFLMKAKAAADGKKLVLERKGDHVTSDVSGLGDLSALNFTLFYTDSARKVKIKRGENEGRTLEYHSPVLSITKLNRSDINGNTLSFKFDHQMGSHVMILLAQNKTGHIAGVGVL